jgi:O-antigen ligase
MILRNWKNARSSSRRPGATWRNSFYGLLIVAPLPLGSNRPIFWAANGVVAFLIVLIFCVFELRSNPQKLRWPILAWALFGLTAVGAWMVVQAMPIMPSALWHPAWRQFGNGAYGAISASPGATWDSAAVFFTIVGISAMAARVGAEKISGLITLKVVVSATLVVSLYGLIARYFGLAPLLPAGNASHAAYLTGTFLNRNTAATYIGLGLVSVFALLGARLEDYWRARATRPPSVAGEPLALWSEIAVFATVGLVLAAALYNTGSRAGIVAAAVGVFVVAGHSLSPRLGMPIRLSLAFLMVAAAMVAAATFAGDQLLLRLAEDGFTDESRFAVYRDTIQMIMARPVLGHGAGTFADVYPLFHGPGAPSHLIWNRAHNVYLQGAAELGIPAFLTLVAILAAIAGRIAVVAKRRSHSAPASIAALAACALVGLHSLVDFSVQIEAVAITFAVLLASGFGESLRSPDALKMSNARDVPPIPRMRLETVDAPIPALRGAPLAPPGRRQ